MNKYEKALDGMKEQIENAIGIKIESDNTFYERVSTLQKLVDRAVPKMVKYEDVGYDSYGGDNIYASICPRCGLHIIEFNDSMIPGCGNDDPREMFNSCMVHHGYIGLNSFCNRCGQALDWSDENE